LLIRPCNQPWARMAEPNSLMVAWEANVIIMKKQ